MEASITNIMPQSSGKTIYGTDPAAGGKSADKETPLPPGYKWCVDEAYRQLTTSPKFAKALSNLTNAKKSKQEIKNLLERSAADLYQKQKDAASIVDEAKDGILNALTLGFYPGQKAEACPLILVGLIIAGALAFQACGDGSIDRVEDIPIIDASGAPVSKETQEYVYSVLKKVPLPLLQGIEEIELVAKAKTGHSSTAGEYSDGVLYLNKGEIKNTLVRTPLLDDYADIILHEIGHHAYKNILSDTEREKVNHILNQLPETESGGRLNEKLCGEIFASYFQTYILAPSSMRINGDCHGSELDQVETKLYRFMKDNLFGEEEFLASGNPYFDPLAASLSPTILRLSYEMPSGYVFLGDPGSATASCLNSDLGQMEQFSKHAASRAEVEFLLGSIVKAYKNFGNPSHASSAENLELYFESLFEINRKEQIIDPLILDFYYGHFCFEKAWRNDSKEYWEKSRDYLTKVINASADGLALYQKAASVLLADLAALNKI